MNPVSMKSLDFCAAKMEPSMRPTIANGSMFWIMLMSFEPERSWNMSTNT